MTGTITVPGFVASTKTPGAYLANVYGGPLISPGDQAMSILLVGNAMLTAITGASPTLATVAGTGALSTVYPIFSRDDAGTRWGHGSELHLMACATFDQYPNATLYGIASLQGSTASTMVCTVTGTPTAAMTARVVVCGRSVDVAIAVSDSVTVIATAIATAINQQTDWPVTAQFSVGVVTITAKHTGIRSNNIGVRVYLISSTASVEAPTGATAGTLACTLAGSTLTLSGGGVLAGTYRLAGGTTEESTAAVLAAILPTRYHRIALAQQTDTEIDRVMVQVNAMAGVATQKLQQCIAASTGTYASVIAISASQNQALGQLVWCRACDRLPGEIAAQVAAARLAGDAVLGGSLDGEATDANANLDGIRLASIPAAHLISDQPTATEIESALNLGVTPLGVTGATGLTYIVRSATTRYLDDSSNPNYAVLDTSVPSTLQYETDAMRAWAAATIAGKKLAADTTDGQGPKVASVITPKIVKGGIYGRLKAAEAASRLTNVDANLALLAVILDPTTSGRLLATIPMAPTPGAHQIAATCFQAP